MAHLDASGSVGGVPVIPPKSPTASKVSLDATLARILSKVHVIPDEETLGPPVSCIRCQDHGVIELTSGTHRTLGHSANNWRGHYVEATPEHPVYVGCDCRHKEPKAKPAKGVYE